MKLEPNQPDPASFSDFDREIMWKRLCRQIENQRDVKKAHAARGIYHELGSDGKYHAVRREPSADITSES